MRTTWLSVAVNVLEVCHHSSSKAEYIVTVSSRTPEGSFSECPLCVACTNIEFSDPAGDATCPNCGCLLGETARILEEVRNRFAESLNVSADRFPVHARFDELGADSLDMVEMVMDLEEQLDINISDEAAQKIQTIGELVRYLESRRRGKQE